MFFSSMLRERHVASSSSTENKQTQTHTNGTGSSSSSNNNNNNNIMTSTSSQADLSRGIRRNNSGVRQRAPQLLLLQGNNNNNRDSCTLNNSLSSSQGLMMSCGQSSSTTNNNHNGNSTSSSTSALLLGSNSGRHPTSSRLFDALTHPAQAAAAAAHAAGSHPPHPYHRGRKRKTTASLVVLTVMCIAVVKYSGSMYDEDLYEDPTSTTYDFENSNNHNFVLEPKSRRARLRSRSPDAPAPPAVAMTDTDTTLDQSPALFSLSRMIRGAPAPPSQPQPQQQHSSLLLPKHIVLRNRIVYALKAAFVADAASMGTHWIYKPDDLATMLQSRDKPEFRSPPQPQYYSAKEYPGHYGHGQASPYGEQLLFVTNYVANMARSFAAARAVTDYDDDNNNNNNNGGGGDESSSLGLFQSILEPMSQAMQEWAESFGGRTDHATLQFLSCRRKKLQDEAEREQYNNGKEVDGEDGEEEEDEDEDEDDPAGSKSCGADDDQAHFFLKVVPMTCLFVGHPNRRQYVEQAIRVHQNNDVAVMYGLTLSDLLERVLLMEDSDENPTTADNKYSNGGLAIDKKIKPVKSLREALDVTLMRLQEEHDEGWFHFAASLTQHHQQREALLNAWSRARDAAEQQMSIEAVAAQYGRSCHMPGALIVSLHALYRATVAESQQQTNSHTQPTTTTTPASASKTTTSLTTHVYRGYHYYVKALLGTIQKTTPTAAPKENEFLVTAVRGNILAGGDTCSRAILVAAVLGAAYGEPPREWWQKMYPVLSGQVEEAAFTIADYVSRRLQR